MEEHKCQYCGEPLENKRRKNCEACSALTVKANKAGTYRAMISTAEKNMKNPDLTPTERRAAMQQAMESGKEQQLEVFRQQRQREEAEKDARRQREFENNKLARQGYKWSKDAIGTEDDLFPGGYGAGIGELSHYEWSLIAPDGKAISKQAALDIIDGKMTLEAYRQQQAEKATTQAVAQAEKEAQAAAEKAADDAQYAAYGQAVETHIGNLVRVKDVSYERGELVAEYVARYHSRRLYRVTINGTIPGYMKENHSSDGSDDQTLYASPDAGLPTYTDRENRFADMFGG